MAGVYIHIPFCKKACHYCNFHFSTQKNHKSLINAILKEIEINQKKFNNKNISTIYFGGGTPSIIKIHHIEEIILQIKNEFNVQNNSEITLEVNPDDVSINKLETWKKIGVNRLSLGVQTFNNKLLKKLNRTHTAEVAIDAVEEIKKIYDNYSIDLMFGIPDSTKESVRKDLFILKKINPPHVSIYNMTLEERTVFYKLFKNNKISLPNENSVLEQYNLILNQLESIGYENYEISNYAKKNYQSKHNSNYWNDKEYIGYGPSAHSYDKKYRYWNIRDNKEYIKLIEENKTVFEKEKLSKKEKINEYILTRVRTNKGVDQKELFIKFNVDLFKEKAVEIKILEREKLIKVDKTILRLTNKGKKISDSITEKITY